MTPRPVPADPPACRSVRASLKAATAEIHDRVEARYAAIFGVDEAKYGQFLTASARAVLSLETVLTETGSRKPIGDWDLRARGAALAADLADMGIVEPALEGASGGGEAFRFGILYVLEGSRHGARQLGRAALGSECRTVRGATRYLLHGEIRTLWPSFLEQLEASPAVRENPGEAVRGAVAAFVAFGDAAAPAGEELSHA